MSVSIIDQCRDPVITRARAAAGGPTPCHRCLAFRPETPSGCLFIERGHTVPKKPEHPPPPPDQSTLW